MRAVRDWIKWEFGRRIEVTTAIKLITIERFLKATILIVGGVIFLVMSGKTDIHRLAENIQYQLNLAPGRGWLRQLVQKAVSHLGTLSRRKEAVIATGAILYGLLEAFEGFGLLLRRRWAEYVVLVATAAFLPLEIEELIRRPTVLKALALLVNLAIVAYLIWRKRLFLERPHHATADPGTPVPADI